MSAEATLIEQEERPVIQRSKSISFNLDPFDAKSNYKSEFGKQGHVPQKISKAILKINGQKSVQSNQSKRSELDD